MSESNFILRGVGFDGLINLGALLFTVNSRGWAIVKKGIIKKRVLNLIMVKVWWYIQVYIMCHMHWHILATLFFLLVCHLFTH